MGKIDCMAYIQKQDVLECFKLLILNGWTKIHLLRVCLLTSFCGTDQNISITSCITKYVDLINFIFRRILNSGWNGVELLALQGDIIAFK